MTYITQSNINNVFGENNVIKWSNLDNDNLTVNSSRVAAAIVWVESYIDSRFRGQRYTIPFSPVPQEVINWSAALAGIWLYEGRGLSDTNKEGNKLQDKKEAVEGEIAACLAGMIKLNTSSHDSSAPSAPISIR